jgi:Domain of unknown function (DUF4190)/GYF domain 2
MYKIIGIDGKEYGPVDLDQVRQWIAQGRVNTQTRLKAGDASDWKPASEIPELAALFAPAAKPPLLALPASTPPVLTSPVPSTKEKGLAIFSFVLGLTAFVLCLSALTGIPAIIFGHVARHRAVRSPERYGGIGFANAGLVLGYVSILFSFVVLALLLPAISKAKQRAQHIQFEQPGQRSNCQNNLRQVGLALKVWALEHNDHFPFNVSTNAGGTLELCLPGPDGYDQNAIAHFRVISNELGTTALLVCPNDPGKRPAPDFSNLRPENITYLLRTGTNVDSENPQEVLAFCPVHGNQLFCDGNVRKGTPSRK